MRKSLLLVPLAGAVLAGFLGGQAGAPQPPPRPKLVTKTVTRTVEAPAPALGYPPEVYQLGDTHDGVTLVGEYHTSYQDAMGASPRTVEAVVFALGGVTREQARRSVLLLSDGTYASADTPLESFPDLPACAANACVAFVNPGLVIKSFLYNGLEWSL